LVGTLEDNHFEYLIVAWNFKEICWGSLDWIRLALLPPAVHELPGVWI